MDSAKKKREHGVGREGEGSRWEGGKGPELQEWEGARRSWSEFATRATRVEVLGAMTRGGA